MSLPAPEILARGSWPLERVDAVWHEEAFEPPPERSAAADAAISALRERGSPSHDGVAARMVGFAADPERLRIDLQPLRWALRLVPGDASDSVAALCLARDGAGRWLAGRRAGWLSSWPGRWALGAGGAVDVCENPADTLVRELDEEWGLRPDRVTAEALVRLPHRMIMFVGMAWVPEDTAVRRDPEHDAHAWWPADVDAWPPEADEPLRRMARLLS